MKKYLKWTLLFSVAFIVATCAYFLLTPKNSAEMFELTYPEEGSGYATTSLIRDLTLYDAQGIAVQSSELNFNNPWMFCNYYTAQQIVIDTVCLNYADYQAFTPATYSATLSLFDEISSYFFAQSKGYLTMKFNVYIANSSETMETAFARERNYTYDRAMFKRYIDNSTEILKHYGDSQAAMIIHSSKHLPKDGAINYPHTAVSLYETPFVSINSGAAVSTYLHELYHTLGLFDLYTGRISDYVGLSDIMSTSTYTESSAYFKSQLGWLNTSDFDDGITTDIEVITESGAYTLSEPSTKGKTTAFKFGERGKEFFLAEMRTFPDNSRYLTVQRINTNYLSNLRANDQSETAVLAFGKMQFYFMKSTGLLSVGDCVGNDSNTLFYADGTRAKFCISNIKNLANGQLSFDFRVFEETLDQSIVGGNQGINNSVEINRDIFVSVILQNGNFGGVTKIWLYNILTGEYEQIKSASIVYIAGLPYYKISGVMPEHTKCKLAVNQYRICEVAEIILTADDRYSVSTRRNIFHDIGDFINDVASTCTDMFHTVFRMIFSD